MKKENREINNIEIRLKKLMEERKLSMGQLSDITNIPKTTIFRYLKDAGTIPTDRLSIIAEALSTTPEYLMGWEEEHENIYGNHKENLKHFANDPELLAFYKDMHESENLKLLFDTGRELTPDELEKVLRYMKMVMDGSL